MAFSFFLNKKSGINMNLHHPKLLSHHAFKMGKCSFPLLQCPLTFKYRMRSLKWAWAWKASSIKVVIRQNLSLNSLREKVSYKALAFGKCMSLFHLDRCESYHKHCVLYSVHVGDNRTKFELNHIKTLGKIHFLVLSCWHQCMCVCVFACEHACMCVCVQYLVTAMFMITLLHCTLIQNGFQE